MNEEAEKEIYDRSVTKIKSTVSNFTTDIMSQFEVAFDQLTNLYHTMSRNDKEKIREQEETIMHMQKTIQEHQKRIENVMQIFSGHLGFNFMAEQKVQKKLNNDLEFGKSIDSRGSSMKMEKHENKQQKNSTSRLNFLSQNESKNRVDGRYQEEPKVEEQEIDGYLRSLQSADKRYSKEPVVIDSEESESEESEGESESESEANFYRKNPLRCLTSHPIYKISYIPNVTKLKYIHYPYRKILLNQKKRRTLIKIRLIFSTDEIQPILLLFRQVLYHQFQVGRNQQTKFLFFSPNYSSLISRHSKLVTFDQIQDNNLITDIRPLKKFDLKKLQDLDVSFNPLELESAEFLAEEAFDSLIYLTASFDTGINEECWQVILKSQQMENYPKLQAVGVCNSNHLSMNMKKLIEECLSRKSIKQRARQLREHGQTKYPENYKVKIWWIGSKEIFDTYDEDKLKEIRNNWEEEVGYDKVRLSRINVRFDNRYGRRHQSNKNKRLQNLSKTQSRHKLITKSRQTKDNPQNFKKKRRSRI